MTKFETIKATFSNGNTFEYAKVNDTCYKLSRQLKDSKDVETYNRPELWELREVLERCRNERTRVRVWYGDINTGKAWNEECGVTGYIGRSSGRIKVPLLINNSRSVGGSALLDCAIIRVDGIATKRTLYRVSNFHVETMQCRYIDGVEYPYQFMQCKDNKEVINIANFKTEKSALHYIQFMEGKRYVK